MVKMMLCVVLFCVGCGATSQQVEIEHVGTLVQSDTHVYVQPVHKTTDVSATMMVEE